MQCKPQHKQISSLHGITITKWTIGNCETVTTVKNGVVWPRFPTGYSLLADTVAEGRESWYMLLTFQSGVKIEGEFRARYQKLSDRLKELDYSLFRSLQHFFYVFTCVERRRISFCDCLPVCWVVGLSVNRLYQNVLGPSE